MIQFFRNTLKFSLPEHYIILLIITLMKFYNMNISIKLIILNKLNISYNYWMMNVTKKIRNKIKRLFLNMIRTNIKQLKKSKIKIIGLI
jgi:hypothetical protein